MIIFNVCLPFIFLSLWGISMLIPLERRQVGRGFAAGLFFFFFHYHFRGLIFVHETLRTS